MSSSVTKIQIIFIISLCCLGLFGFSYSMEKNYKEDIKSFKEYVKKATTLIDLQNKWSNKKEDKKLLQSIKKRFKPTSYIVKKDIYILEFKNLDKTKLDRLGKALLNSSLTFKKIDLKRDKKQVSLHVEVKI